MRDTIPYAIMLDDEPPPGPVVKPPVARRYSPALVIAFVVVGVVVAFLDEIIYWGVGPLNPGRDNSALKVGVFVGCWLIGMVWKGIADDLKSSDVIRF